MAATSSSSGVILAVVAGGARSSSSARRSSRPARRGLQKVAVVVAAQTIPARKPIEAADVSRPRGPARRDQRPGHRHHPDKVIGRVPAVTSSPARWSRPTCSPRAPRAASSRSSGPTRRSAPTRAPWRAVSMTVPDDRAVGGLLQAEPDGRRLRDRHRQRPPGPRARRGQLLHRQVDEDHLPEHGHPGQGRARSTSSGRRSRVAEEITHLAGQRQRHVQPGPAARRRRPHRRRVAARRDDEPDHRPLRPADPGGLPARRAARVPTRPPPTPLATPAPSPSAAREPRPPGAIGRSLAAPVAWPVAAARARSPRR